MDVRTARGNERMLRRVIALIVAFAVLAARVADRSLAVRWLVLWILRRAETVAAEFVFEQAGTPPPAVEFLAAFGNGPENALRLAARFNALAEALRALLPVGDRFGHRPARPGFAFGHGAPGSGRYPDGCTREPFDTS